MFSALQIRVLPSVSSRTSDSLVISVSCCVTFEYAQASAVYFCSQCLCGKFTIIASENRRLEASQSQVLCKVAIPELNLYFICII